MKKLKKFLLSSSVAALLLPGLALAAYNDVTLTTDTIINAGGVNLNVSGSSAVIESIVVSASSFDITLLPNSSATIISTDRRTLTPSVANSVYVVNTCGPSSSTLVLTANPSVSTVTISVTPSSSACSTANTSGGGGGGGGGGGIVASAATTPTTSTTQTTTSTVSTAAAPVTTTTSTQGQATTGSSGVAYTRPISLGSSGADVSSLQTLLESKGFLTMPEGAAKGYFGGLTKSALAAYQKSVGIDPLGIVGPATRAHLNSSQTQTASPAASLSPVSTGTSGSYERGLSVGSKGDDVSSLQTLLESKGFLTMPEGAAKGYFGGLTKSALAAYQKSVGIDPLGIVGPATRAHLNALPN